MKAGILISIVLFLSTQTFGQSKGTLNEAPVQFTLITPLGTNGSNSINTVNTVSFNLFGGYHAGLEGAEFGAFVNMNRDYVNGFQFAGMVNYTHGDAKGAQFSGIINSNLGDVNAFQFAGVTNVNMGESRTFQFAGVTNVNLKGSQIFQGAGVINFTMGTSNVIQAAGVANYSEELEGAQLSGVGNFALKDVRGVQAAGVGNIAKSIEGAQVAGVGNISKSVNGAQLAGIANGAINVRGVQVAAIGNIAKRVDGFQIGMVNLADTVENGIPIGMLSIARNGFHEFELGFSEGLNTYAALKLGVDQFYNIFTIGTQFFGDFRWGVGYGIGTHLANKTDLKVNLEAISYQINEGTEWTDAYNGLQQLKLTFAGGKNEHVKFFAGPSFNLMTSQYVKEDGRIGSDFPPYHFTNSMSGNTNLKFWIGFNAGIKLH